MPADTNFMEGRVQGVGSMAPPGWYVDPAGLGQRYWDGGSWTGHVAPIAPQTVDVGHVARAGDWIGGVLLSLIIPIVGLIAGIVYVARGGPRARCGWMCIGLSIAASLVYFAALSQRETQTYYYPTQQQQDPPTRGGNYY
jgi:hypothetical protein